jgi:hypothetical protein
MQRGAAGLLLRRLSMLRNAGHFAFASSELYFGLGGAPGGAGVF